jgi:transposase
VVGLEAEVPREEAAQMIIIGFDFHPSYQQIALLDTTTGTTEERKLAHASGAAERFYRKVALPALLGIEAVGNDQWFIQLLETLGYAVRVGDPAQIRASYVRQQKTDRRDAKHILRLLVDRDTHPIANCSFIGTDWFRYARE